MRVLRLTPAFFLFTLLMIPMLSSQQAYAEWLCCSAGECHWWCKCPGYDFQCSWYPKPKQAVGMVETKRESVVTVIGSINSGSAKRLTKVMRGSQCFQNRTAFSLLGNALSSLKFEPIPFDEKVLQKQTVALLMSTDK